MRDVKLLSGSIPKGASGLGTAGNAFPDATKGGCFPSSGRCGTCVRWKAALLEWGALGHAHSVLRVPRSRRVVLVHIHCAPRPRVPLMAIHVAASTPGPGTRLLIAQGPVVPPPHSPNTPVRFSYTGFARPKNYIYCTANLAFSE